MTERKIHIKSDEAIVATTAGAVVGIAVTCNILKDAYEVEAIKMGLAILPYAASGALKTYSREKMQKENQSKKR